VSAGFKTAWDRKSRRAGWSFLSTELADMFKLLLKEAFTADAPEQHILLLPAPCRGPMPGHHTPIAVVPFW